MNNYLLDIISKVIACFLDHYSIIRFFVPRYIQYLSYNSEIASFQETPTCVKSVWKGCQFLDTSVQTQSYCTCVPNFKLILEEEIFYLCLKLRCVRSAVRSRLLRNVRCKNGCAMSSIGKVDLLFGFNCSIKPLLY